MSYQREIAVVANPSSLFMSYDAVRLTIGKIFHR
jgi:hypothetical protein